MTRLGVRIPYHVQEVQPSRRDRDNSEVMVGIQPRVLGPLT